MKDTKRTGKMPMHTFKVLVDFTYDRFYRKGESIKLDHEKTVENLIKNKIIK